MAGDLHALTGLVFRVERARGPVWYAKYRLPDGRKIQKKIAPAWTGRGRPAAGYVTKRLAEDWLRELLEEARRGTLPALVRTGATFADRPIEAITTAMIESWIAGVDRTPATRVKLLAMVHGIFQRVREVWGLTVNPAVDVEKPPLRSTGDIEVFSPDEVWALVRAAASEQDAAIFLTAAFSGLRRGELIALRWRDVDFAGSVIRVRAGYCGGCASTICATRSAPG